jgi:hypothetical protein
LLDWNTLELIVSEIYVEMRPKLGARLSFGFRWYDKQQLTPLLRQVFNILQSDSQLEVRGLPRHADIFRLRIDSDAAAAKVTRHWVTNRREFERVCLNQRAKLKMKV